jgi:hypothetical protein
VELYDLYSLPTPTVIRLIKSRIRCPGHVARIGDRRGAYRILVGIPEGKRRPGRTRLRWGDNIEINL